MPMKAERERPARRARSSTPGQRWGLPPPRASALDGAGANPLEFCEVVEAVSTVDGSTGWCVMISGCYGHFAGLLPPLAATEIFGESGAVVSAHSGPTGWPGPSRVGIPGEWPMAAGQWQFPRDVASRWLPHRRW